MGVERVRRPLLDACSCGFAGRHGDGLVRWLRKHFHPVEESTGNSLLWRILPADIAVNFDLATAEDADALCDGAIAHVLHTTFAGGRPAMLAGIYAVARN